MSNIYILWNLTFYTVPALLPLPRCNTCQHLQKNEFALTRIIVAHENIDTISK